MDGIVTVSTVVPEDETATGTMICHAMLAVAYDARDPTPLIIKGVEVWGLPATADASKPPREKIAACRR